MFGRTCTLIMLSAGLAGVGGGIAAPQGAVTRYLIVSGDSISGSWDSRDEHLIKQLRSQYGNHFVWFRQTGHDYVGSGDSLLADIQAAMAPQREVNRRQSDVNRHQNEVNSRQSEVNHGGGVGQDEVNHLQHDVNAKQNDVNAEQRKVNDQQSVVDKEQNVVNQSQREANVEIKEALDSIFDSALARGLVHEVK